MYPYRSFGQKPTFEDRVKNIREQFRDCAYPLGQNFQPHNSRRIMREKPFDHLPMNDYEYLHGIINYIAQQKIPGTWEQFDIELRQIHNTRRDGTPNTPEYQIPDSYNALNKTFKWVCNNTPEAKAKAAEEARQKAELKERLAREKAIADREKAVADREYRIRVEIEAAKRVAEIKLAQEQAREEARRRAEQQKQEEEALRARIQAENTAFGNVLENDPKFNNDVQNAVRNLMHPGAIRKTCRRN